MSNDVSLGLAHEAEVTLHKAGATAKNFWNPLSRNVQLAKEVVSLVTKRLAIVHLELNPFLKKRPEIRFSYDEVPPWRLVEDIGETSISFSVQDLEVVEFLNNRDQHREIDGEKMKRRALKMGACLNQHFAEVLVENQQVLSEDWQGYLFLFPGTVWEYRDWRVIPYMSYRNNDKIWILGFTRTTDGKHRIGSPGNYDFGDVDSSDRLLRLQSK